MFLKEKIKVSFFYSFLFIYLFFQAKKTRGDRSVIVRYGEYFMYPVAAPERPRDYM